MTQRDVTGQESRDETDQAPDQDRVQVKRESLTIDRDNHIPQKTRYEGLVPWATFPARSPRTAPSTRLKAGNGWIRSASVRMGVATFTASSTSPRISPARGVTIVAPIRTPRLRSATSFSVPP